MIQHIEAWHDLVATALVGTSRKPARLPATGSPAGDVLAGLDSVNPERALLVSAATLTLYRRAGWMAPSIKRTAPAPCPPDTRPCCTPAATEYLATMLGKTYADVLPEWLAALARAGQRIPEAYLADILEVGYKQPALRKAILPVLGQRGYWLAAQNPNWQYASASLPETFPADEAALVALWETASRAARLELLQQLRSHMPARARDLLLTTWNTEKADDRAAFLATFAHGLSMADEPFLEQRLGDRSKEVRRIVVSLLIRLPDARLVQRMIARVQPRLTWQAGQTGPLAFLPSQSAQLTLVDLPETCDADMIRDGIEPEPPRYQKLGKKAWLMVQMLGSIPPSYWIHTWNAQPDDLVAAAAAQRDWHAVLLGGWTTAAIRTNDEAWLEAILQARLDQIGRDPQLREAVEQLSPQRYESLMLRLFARYREPISQKHPAFEILQISQSPWGAELTHTVLDSLRRRVVFADATLARDYQLYSLLPALGLRMLPDLATEAAENWPTDKPHWQIWAGLIDSMLAVLTFRHDMLKEFCP